MTASEFIPLFADAVGVEPQTIGLETELSTLETWDSVAYLAVLAIVDEKLGVMLDPEALVAAKTVADIHKLATQ